MEDNQSAPVVATFARRQERLLQAQGCLVVYRPEVVNVGCLITTQVLNGFLELLSEKLSCRRDDEVIPTTGEFLIHDAAKQRKTWKKRL